MPKLDFLILASEGILIQSFRSKFWKRIGSVWKLARHKNSWIRSFLGKRGLKSLPILALYLLLLPVKLLSLLVPKKENLIVVGIGKLPENALSILRGYDARSARGQLVIIIPKNHRYMAHAQLMISDVPTARIVNRHTLGAAWCTLRASWVLVTGGRSDVQLFWLSRARLAYLNHGIWLKEPTIVTSRRTADRMIDIFFGSYVIGLASHSGEIDLYQRMLGPNTRVLDLGYPREPWLRCKVERGLNPTKIGIYPTWKSFSDHTYNHDFCRRLQKAVAEVLPESICIEYQPHPISPDKPLTLGDDDGRPPGIVITDFSSLAFDQAVLGGHVLLFSKVTEEYLIGRGVRREYEQWLRKHMITNEDELVRKISILLKDGSGSTHPPVDLRPFNMNEFWSLLHDTR